MKTILSLSLLLCISLTAHAQLGIGTTTPSQDALLEFGREVRGVVLGPSNAVTSTNAQTAAGSICFDAASGSFRMYDGSWSTVVSGGQTGGAETGTDTFTQYIGTTSSTTGGSPTNGVLIFGEDTGETKALVLPSVCNADQAFTNPVVGLMVYDPSTQMVMVYNGNAWTSF